MAAILTLATLGFIVTQKNQVMGCYQIAFSILRNVLELEKLQKFASEDASYDSRARYPPPRCHPGTRVQVLKKISDWINDPDPPQRILWLSGPAGAGKSAIAQTVAERFHDTQLAASFFFQKNTSDRGVSDRLFLTLAWQLATSIPKIRPYLKSTLKAERSIHVKSITVQFHRLFMKAFKLLLRDEPGFCPAKNLIIIDALDECDSDQDQKTILTLIGDELASRRSPLRFLICSRPEAHIQETFKRDIMNRTTLSLVLDETDDDIRKYLQDEFSRIFSERRILLLPEANVIDRLVSEASGQFIYASTLIKFVDGGNQDRNFQTQLDTILKQDRRQAKPAFPYSTLDQLYIQILSQQPNVRLLRDVFVLVVALGRVDIAFVCRRLRMSKEDLMSNLLPRMHSILKISDTAIEAYHLSLHDFFQDKSRAGRYYIHPMRVRLVRRPQKIERFSTRNEEPLTLAFIAGGGVIVWMIIGILVFRGAALAGWIVVSAVLTTGFFIWIFNQDRILARGIRKGYTNSAV